MQTIVPGHHYHLNVLDAVKGLEGPYTSLTFVQRFGDKYPGNRQAHPGTTSQEVLRALLERARYVWRQQPCWETKVSIWLMRWVIWLYEYRACKVHEWPTMGLTLDKAEFDRTCLECGHLRSDYHTIHKGGTLSYEFSKSRANGGH